jgi:tetratricopeptide (TPR) repeat protein
MAKKRKKDGDNPKRRKRSTPAPEDLPPGLPDRRAMESSMRELLQGLQGEGARDTALDKAQEIIYQAFEARDTRRKIALARKALTISLDCADAHVLLAELAPTRKEALKLYEQGVAAGERAIDPATFQDGAGHFWGLLETRPYMRARLGLALSLWTAGRRKETIEHLQEMLRLNPNDNQGVRYTLAGFLLFLDRDDDLARLLDQYPDDDMASWAYTRALLAFRREGDSSPSRELLQKAKKANRHVPDYLLGRKHPSGQEPGYYSPGKESEALEYISTFLASWKYTPGAIAWLREHDEQTQKRKSEVPQAKGPLAFIRQWLREHLPQQEDVWQADCRAQANPILAGGEKVRPWLVLVISHTDDLVLGHELTFEPPSAALLWDTVVKAMQHPLVGEPHRPSELQVRSDPRWESLRPHLKEIGIPLATPDRLEHLDFLFKDIGERLSGTPRPGMLDAPGVTPEQVGGVWEAAAEFYRQAPWKKIGYESAIKVECSKYQSGPWYAVVMGQSGLAPGLALYEDFRLLQWMWQEQAPDEDSGRETVATSITFDEEVDVPLADLEAAQQYGWKVAGPDAYPSIFRKERGMTMRPLLAWELELSEGCLRALPDFVERRQQDDPAPESMTVPTASGPLTLVLSWMTESNQ